MRDHIPTSQRHPLHRMEEIRSASNLFMVLRLCWASLEKQRDLYLPSLGSADIDSIVEGSVVDYGKYEYVEVQVISTPIVKNKLLLILVAGALLLVERSNEGDDKKIQHSGICRAIAPIHRVEVGSDIKDTQLLHLWIRSYRKIGLSVRVGFKEEWFMSIKFDSESKTILIRSRIEKAALREREGRFNRIEDMLQKCCIE